MQRNLTEAERGRVRQRGLEAEEQRKGRTAQVLEQAPKKGAGQLCFVPIPCCHADRLKYSHKLFITLTSCLPLEGRCKV